MVAPFPSIFCQQSATGGKILQGSGIGSCRLGTLARLEVELGDLLAFLRRSDQRRAAVKLVHDVEDAVFEFFRRTLGREQSANPKMSHSTLALRDKRVRRLLDPVVEEGVRGV